MHFEHPKNLREGRWESMVGVGCRHLTVCAVQAILDTNWWELDNQSICLSPKSEVLMSLVIPGLTDVMSDSGGTHTGSSRRTVRSIT